MNSIGHQLLELSPLAMLLLKLTLFLGAAWLLHALLHRANPRWRVLLWRCAMVGLLVLPLAHWLAPGYALEVAPAAPEAAAPLAGPVPVVEEWPLYFEPAPAYEAQPDLTLTAASASARTPTRWRDYVLPGILAAWALLALLRVAAFGRAFLHARHFAAQAMPAPEHVHAAAREVAAALRLWRQVTVRVTPFEAPPFLHGVRRPVVVLPARMAAPDFAPQLPAVLAHELAHAAHHDLAWLHLARLLAAPLWFHPLAWRIPAAHEAACEAVCDGVAANYIGDPERYAQTLAQAALDFRARPGLAASAPMLRSPRVLHRIRQLQRGLNVPALKRRWVAAATLALLAGAGTLASVRFTEAAPEAVEAPDAAPLLDPGATPLDAAGAHASQSPEAQVALEHFHARYRLEDGEVLRHIPPPFMAERAVYWQQERGEEALPHTMFLGWTDAFSFRAAIGGGFEGPPRLDELIPKLTRLRLSDIAGPEAFFAHALEGDWVVREGAPTAAVLEALFAIVEREFGVDASFEQQRMERPVLMISGSLHPSLQTDNYRVISTTHIAPEVQGPGGGTRDASLPEAFEWLLGMPVVDLSTGTRWPRLSLEQGAAARSVQQARGLTPESRALAGEILADLARQTGLEFEIEMREREVWVFEQAGASGENGPATRG